MTVLGTAGQALTSYDERDGQGGVPQHRSPAGHQPERDHGHPVRLLPQRREVRDSHTIARPAAPAPPLAPGATPTPTPTPDALAAGRPRRRRVSGVDRLLGLQQHRAPRGAGDPRQRDRRRLLRRRPAREGVARASRSRGRPAGALEPKGRAAARAGRAGGARVDVLLQRPPLPVQAAHRRTADGNGEVSLTKLFRSGCARRSRSTSRSAAPNTIGKVIALPHPAREAAARPARCACRSGRPSRSGAASRRCARTRRRPRPVRRRRAC